MSQSSALDRAADTIRQGGVIAYPTEAVYGLGCDPQNQAAVLRLLEIKQRSPQQGLILIGRSLDDFAPYIQPLDDVTSSRIQASWPGPVTWLVEASADCPEWLRGKHKTIAIRATAHRQTRDLCEELGAPLVSTSANRSGEPAAETEEDVRTRLGNEIDFILGGPTDGMTRPSQIRDARTSQIIRE